MTKRPKHVHSKHVSKNKVNRVMVLGEANGVYKFNPSSNADTTLTYIYFNQQTTNILLREQWNYGIKEKITF